MLKSNIILFVLIVSLFSCSNENNEVLFSLGATSDTKSFESSNGGKLYSDTLIISKMNVPDSVKGKVDKELKFIRNEDAILPLKTRYFYDSKTQQTLCVLYQWDRLKPGMSNVESDSLLNLDDNNMAIYDEKFNEIGKMIIEKFGEPNHGHGNLRQEKFNMLDMWKRQLIWDIKNHYVELNMVWIPKTGYRIFKIYLVYYPKK